MKRILIACSALALAACSPSVKEVAPVPERLIPSGLSDCAFFEIFTEAGKTIHVIRCPNASVTAFVPGKSPVTSTTIDGTSGVSTEDARRAAYDALLAKINAEIKRLELKAAELERERLK